METLKDLKDQRASKLDAQDQLLKTRKNESRDFSEDEKKQFRQLDDAIKALDERIAQAEAEERAEQRIAKQKLQDKGGSQDGLSKQEQRDFDKYSLHKAVKAQLEGREVKGFEAEMHQEAVKESRAAGGQVEGIGVPSKLAVRMIKGQQGEKRDMVAGTPANGGYFVPTEVEETVIGALRPRLVLAQAGAVTMGNLEGDIDMPRSSGTTVSWKAETGDADDGEPTIDRVQLSPKRVTAFTDVSRQLIRQSSPDVEAFLREDFFGAVAASIDGVGIGGGGANEPDGVLSTAGVGAVYAGGAANDGVNADGAALIRQDLLNLEKEVAIDNADMGSLAYLQNPKTRAALKALETSTGSGRFVQEVNDELNGYRNLTTTNVPSNLSKGNGSDLSAVIFGNFRDLIIGQWGGLDLIVNPYTKAKKGTIEMIVHQYLDIALRHPESFAAVKDAVAA